MRGKIAIPILIYPKASIYFHFLEDDLSYHSAQSGDNPDTLPSNQETALEKPIPDLLGNQGDQERDKEEQEENPKVHNPNSMHIDPEEPRAEDTVGKRRPRYKQYIPYTKDYEYQYQLVVRPIL
jgi:hypothetical protein